MDGPEVYSKLYQASIMELFAKMECIFIFVHTSKLYSCFSPIYRQVNKDEIPIVSVWLHLL